MSWVARGAAVVALSFAATGSFAARGIVDSLGPTPAVLPASGPFHVDVDLTGWQTYAGFGSPLNSEAFFQFAPGTEALGFDFIDVTFTTANGSWGSELTLSVNDSGGIAWLDWRPSTADSGGTFGPLSGSWGTGPGRGGTFGAGAPFTMLDGTMWVTVYESFNDAGDALDATITGGMLRIYTSAAPIPEPATYGLMALGLMAVGAVARRRRAR